MDDDENALPATDNLTRRYRVAWHFIHRIYCMLVLLTPRRRLVTGRPYRSNLEQ
jgi:hypothetical protein